MILTKHYGLVSLAVYFFSGLAMRSPKFLWPFEAKHRAAVGPLEHLKLVLHCV